MYLLIHHDVIFHKRHFFPVSVKETFQNRRSFQRAAEIEALRSVHQLDGKDMFEIVHYFIEFGGGVGAHAYVVFLSVGRDISSVTCATHP